MFELLGRSLISIALFSAVLSLCPVAAPASEKPNVLLILVDDLKPALGCYGDPVAKTPHMDALARRGMRFDLAYCNQAVCAPSRFTLMLGSHSTSTGLYRLGSHLRTHLPKAVTMPQHFAKHGYRTESLGKVFHIGHGNPGDPQSFSVPHYHDKVIEYLDPASTGGGRLTREEALFTNQKLDQIRSLPRGAAFESPVASDTDYADGRIARETVRRLRAAKQRQERTGTPFFITVGFVRPHLPFSVPEKYWELYDPEQLPMPQYEQLPTGAPPVAGKHGGEITAYKPVPPDGSVSESLKRKLVHGYYASTSFVDEQIGKVVSELDRLQLADDTIVVLWGDHGFHLGDLGMWTKHTNYEQANRIPILVIAPGVARPDSSTKQLAESVDLFPTLADLAGLPAPKGPQPIDGVSLVPVLRDAKARVRDHAYHAYPKKKLGRAIRTERYRLVEWKSPGEQADTAEYELYDYQTDPLETENLAPEKPGIVEQLKGKLAAYPNPVDPDKKRNTSPHIGKKQLTIAAEVRSSGPRGVVLAQGGREHGYSLHFVDEKPAFDVRIGGKVTRVMSTQPVQGEIRLTATLDRQQMSLSVNGEPAIEKASPGLIPVQPKDELSVGFDSRSAAGNYQPPNQFHGQILRHSIDVAIPKVAMCTPWGEKVTAENAWQEYPRPAMRRKQWRNLNGLWDYTVTGKDVRTAPSNWDGRILVPFAIEAPLSGVEKHFQPDDALWYRRTVQLEKNTRRHYRLNFEAVDYQSTLWVNGHRIGSHTGGNLPFSFDITQALVSGENTITVRVTDATDSPGTYQLHGKQRLSPRGIWYTPVSGIWQTVWLEEVPEVHITALQITPAIDGTVSIGIKVNREEAQRAKVAASMDGRQIAVDEGAPDRLQLTIPDPQLWSPDSPTLYDLKIELGDDVVHSYVGLREVGRRRDADGHWRFTLNGRPIFHWGTLDQGWWPDGLLTPPSDKALRSDIEFLKAAGFNTIRKHIKVEPRRFYYHCDRIGMMVWQDQVSAMEQNPEWTRLQPEPETRTWPEDAHRQFMAELQGMIDTLYNHPCIVLWVPFNERWGQHQTKEVGRWTVAYDPTRLVNVASGGNFLPVGHVVDHHQYPHPGFPFEFGEGGRFDDYVKVVGEFGGHGFPVQDHVWDPGTRNWGYGGLPKDKGEWLERYRTSVERLGELKEKGIAAGIYTQTTDVEGEINGLITYDRRVRKLNPKQLVEIAESAGLID